MKGRGSGKDEQEAIKWLSKAGDRGHIAAENALGSFYMVGGDTVSKSRGEAIKWFRMAARNGDKWAKETLQSLGVRE